MTDQQKEAHRQKMTARRVEQRSRTGRSHAGLPVLKNDPHHPHSHARENARRLRQRAP